MKPTCENDFNGYDLNMEDTPKQGRKIGYARVSDQDQSIRLNQAHFLTHNLSALISAFPVSMSLRMSAVRTIFGGLPAATI